MEEEEEGDARKDCNEVDGARTASDRACISECWRSVGMVGCRGISKKRDTQMQTIKWTAKSSMPTKRYLTH